MGAGKAIGVRYGRTGGGEQQRAGDVESNPRRLTIGGIGEEVERAGARCRPLS